VISLAANIDMLKHATSDSVLQIGIPGNNSSANKWRPLVRNNFDRTCRNSAETSRLQALAVKPKLLLSSWNSTYFMRLKIQ
jgi:hypothetical protein